MPEEAGAAAEVANEVRANAARSARSNAQSSEARPTPRARRSGEYEPPPAGRAHRRRLPGRLGPGGGQARSGSSARPLRAPAVARTGGNNQSRRTMTARGRALEREAAAGRRAAGPPPPREGAAWRVVDGAPDARARRGYGRRLTRAAGLGCPRRRPPGARAAARRSARRTRAPARAGRRRIDRAARPGRSHAADGEAPRGRERCAERAIAAAAAPRFAPRERERVFRRSDPGSRRAPATCARSIKKDAPPPIAPRPEGGEPRRRQPRHERAATRRVLRPRRRGAAVEPGKRRSGTRARAAAASRRADAGTASRRLSERRPLRACGVACFDDEAAPRSLRDRSRSARIGPKGASPGENRRARPIAARRKRRAPPPAGDSRFGPRPAGARTGTPRRTPAGAGDQSLSSSNAPRPRASSLQRSECRPRRHVHVPTPWTGGMRLAGFSRAGAALARSDAWCVAEPSSCARRPVVHRRGSPIGVARRRAKSAAGGGVIVPAGRTACTRREEPRALAPAVAASAARQPGTPYATDAHSAARQAQSRRTPVDARGGSGEATRTARIRREERRRARCSRATTAAAAHSLPGA